MNEFDALPERVTDQCADAGILPALASLVEAILEELERQNPDAVRQEEPGTIWLSGGCTPRSAGCIIDADALSEAVRDHIARGAA